MVVDPQDCKTVVVNCVVVVVVVVEWSYLMMIHPHLVVVLVERAPCLGLNELVAD